MKTLFTFCFIIFALAAAAHNPYALFLRAQAQRFSGYAPYSVANNLTTTTKALPQIPKIETPRGAVFCRLEDYLTQKTKVWIKVGVR
ncbi:MAG: hypothetical protein IPH78_00660 [Bacteroidetes bacterium]|nr:hypothetical protein [Bacteroidota bacterium]MBK8659292.1 hypothetical protein [Bacteroidota bacterium]